MTDRLREKARQLAAQYRGDGYDFGDLEDDIHSALLSERDRALEEAARICDAQDCSAGRSDLYADGFYDALIRVEHEIKSLKSRQ